MSDYDRKNDRITGKILLSATLKNTAPLMMGRGPGDRSDMEIMRLPDGTPYIPGSSIAGVIRHLTPRIDVDQTGREWFFPVMKKPDGTEEEQAHQSHIRFDDLVGKGEAQTVIRDGVRIDHKTGTAEDKKKYDYELLDTELSFPFRAEITLRQSMDKPDEIMHFAQLIMQALQHPDFRIGGLTNHGFGRMEAEEPRIVHFDFTKGSRPDETVQKHRDTWFDFIQDEQGTLPVGKDFDLELPPKLSAIGFCIEASFRLDTALLIGAYGIEAKEPDKSPLKSRGKSILPAKSIRGALRHRARRILDIQEHSGTLLKDLFGDVDEKANTQQRGRLRIEESTFSHVDEVPQTRIAIDHFTGGTMQTALFESQALWQTGDEDNVTITLSIPYADHSPEERTLLLHLLKDLWTRDLPIGGEKQIGRGYLQGRRATIYENGVEKVSFTAKGESGLSLTEKDLQTLETILQ